MRLNAYPGGLLQLSPSRTPTSDLDREGEGDLGHGVHAPEMVGPHRTSTRGGMY